MRRVKESNGGPLGGGRIKKIKADSSESASTGLLGSLKGLLLLPCIHILVRDPCVCTSYMILYSYLLVLLVRLPRACPPLRPRLALVPVLVPVPLTGRPNPDLSSSSCGPCGRGQGRGRGRGLGFWAPTVTADLFQRSRYLLITPRLRRRWSSC